MLKQIITKLWFFANMVCLTILGMRVFIELFARHKGWTGTYLMKEIQFVIPVWLSFSTALLLSISLLIKVILTLRRNDQLEALLVRDREFNEQSRSTSTARTTSTTG